VQPWRITRNLRKPENQRRSPRRIRSRRRTKLRRRGLLLPSRVASSGPLNKLVPSQRLLAPNSSVDLFRLLGFPKIVQCPKRDPCRKCGLSLSRRLMPKPGRRNVPMFNARRKLAPKRGPPNILLFNDRKLMRKRGQPNIPLFNDRKLMPKRGPLPASQPDPLRKLALNLTAAK
jgi:hypothetical protein